MGRDKAKLLIGEESLLETNLSVMKETFEEVIQVGGELPEKWRGKVSRVHDQIQGQGPLGGLHSALLHAAYPWVFLSACDMPFLNRDVILFMEGLRESFDVVVPRVRGRYETLHAFYSKGCLSLVEKHLNEGLLALHSLYPHLRVHEIDESKLATLGGGEMDRFFNVNTPAELEEARFKKGLGRTFA
jgi:molybdopterin-guanine dinucleotide biosynthesis protein A